MTWLDHKALMIARQLREPASRRRYTRRLHELDPVHGGHRSREDMCLLHETPRERATRGRVKFKDTSRPIKDLRGETFGMLTVIDYWGRKGRKIMRTCRCDCGKVKTIIGSNLISGRTRSCGCQRGQGSKKKGGNHSVVQGR